MRRICQATPHDDVALAALARMQRAQAGAAELRDVILIDVGRGG